MADEINKPALEINFNNPHILRGHLEQVLPQMGLEGVEIIVGVQGGLAYPLFEDDYSRNIPRAPHPNKLSEMKLWKTYFDAVDTYVTRSRELAESFNFRLLSFDSNQTALSINPTQDEIIYQLGIGDVSIESAKRLESFLQMVQKGFGDPGEKHLYNALVEMVKTLPGQ